MRQIVLDTETTGLETSQGHRIIEIGCVELFNRRLTGRHYHQYINPEREIDAGAQAVHGISNAMLADKPVFARIADDFLNFVGDAELVIHNAAFDIGFLNYEMNMLRPGFGSISDRIIVGAAPGGVSMRTTDLPWERLPAERLLYPGGPSLSQWRVMQSERRACSQ